MNKLVIGGELPKNEALVSSLHWEVICGTRYYTVSKGSFGYHICAIAEYYVVKDSEEYDKITKMIDTEIKASSICEYLDTLIISHMQPKEIINLIEDIQLVSFNRGVENIQEQMRLVLGFEK